jgi:hypothetical protein
MPHIEGQVGVPAEDVIARLAQENASTLQRAIMAEAGNAARDAIIAELRHEVASLTEQRDAAQAVLDAEGDAEKLDPF